MLERATAAWVKNLFGNKERNSRSQQTRRIQVQVPDLGVVGGHEGSNPDQVD